MKNEQNLAKNNNGIGIVYVYNIYAGAVFNLYNIYIEYASMIVL